MTTAHKIDLIQDYTTDCSLVASLCACLATWERGHATVGPPLLPMLIFTLLTVSFD